MFVAWGDRERLPCCLGTERPEGGASMVTLLLPLPPPDEPPDAPTLREAAAKGKQPRRCFYNRDLHFISLLIQLSDAHQTTHHIKSGGR